MKGFQICISAILLVNLLLISSAKAVLVYQPTSVDIIANGTVGSGEWVGAGWEQDVGGASMGAMYGMWKTDYLTYSGNFRFLMHNIEQAPSAENADYNVFDIIDNSFSQTDPLLRLWVFNNTNESDDSGWLSNAGLSNDFSSIDDRGFLVRNYALGQYSQWLPGDGTPEDGNYAWDDYWGFYASGGFNNSAYEAGLSGAQDGSNELYEVIFKGGDLLPSRSILDPDKGDPTMPLISYWEGEISTVPLPGAIWLFGSGLIGLIGFRRKFKSQNRYLTAQCIQGS
jgi:hypothetical protein